MRSLEMPVCVCVTHIHVFVIHTYMYLRFAGDYSDVGPEVQISGFTRNLMHDAFIRKQTCVPLCVCATHIHVFAFRQ
jgi:hypothetical protein